MGSRSICPSGASLFHSACPEGSAMLSHTAGLCVVEAEYYSIAGTHPTFSFHSSLHGQEAVPTPGLLNGAAVNTGAQASLHDADFNHFE